MSSRSSDKQCVVCLKKGNNTPGITSIGEEAVLKINVFYNTQVVKDAQVCSKCVMKAYNSLRRKKPSTVNVLAKTQASIDNHSQFDQNNNEIIYCNIAELKPEITSKSESKIESEFESESEIKSGFCVESDNKNPKLIRTTPSQHRQEKKTGVRLRISKALANHNCCTICKKKFKNKKKFKKQKKVLNEALVMAYVETGIYIPKDARACVKHFKRNSNFLTESALQELSSISDRVVLNEIKCTNLIEGLREHAIRSSIFDKFINPYSVSDDLTKQTTGLNAQQFLEIYENLVSINESKNRTKSQALAIYLFWLKTGISQADIAAYFGTELNQIDIRYKKL